MIGILRALPDPSAAEWRLLKRRLGRRSPSASRLWPVLRTKPWFRRLTAEGVLKNWLASEDDELRDHALEIAAEVPEDEAGRVIELLAPYANQPGFDELARRMVEVGNWRLPSILKAASLELEEKEGADGSEDTVVAALWEESGRLARERDARQPDYSPADVDAIPSPIPAAEASEMSDAEWQLAIAEYGDDHDGQSPVGGAEAGPRARESGQLGTRQVRPARLDPRCLGQPGLPQRDPPRPRQRPQGRIRPRLRRRSARRVPWPSGARLRDLLGAARPSLPRCARRRSGAGHRPGAALTRPLDPPRFPRPSATDTTSTTKCVKPISGAGLSPPALALPGRRPLWRSLTFSRTIRTDTGRAFSSRALRSSSPIPI